MTKRKDTTDDRDGGEDWYDRLHRALLRGEKGAAGAALKIAKAVEWSERRRQDARSRGGGARKYNLALQELVDRLVVLNDKVKPRNLWNEIPEGDSDDELPIYRDRLDSETVVVVDDSTGRRTSIKYETFRTSYVPRARN